MDAATPATAEHPTLAAWAQFALAGGMGGAPVPVAPHRSPGWLTDLRPFEVLALLGALGYVLHAFLHH